VFRQRTELVGLEETGSGFRAATGAGVIEARRVVNCAGAAAGKIAAMLGIGVAVQGFPIQVNVTAAVAPTVPHLVYAAGHRLTLKQTANGTFLIGGGWPARLDPRTGRALVDFDSMMANLATAKRIVPIVASADLVRSWAAIVDGTEDWKPIIGEAPGH
jgi:glycine/D-amino acid oxidase-like deaminating enzyme